MKLTNIILIGFMGSGKTSIGKKISEKLNYTFLDTDEIIEKKTGFTISKIFKLYGEKHFRELEKNLLIDFIYKKLKHTVIATGGGMACYNKNNLLLKTLGEIFFLKNSKKVLLKRIKNDTRRPLRFVSNLFEKRQHCYQNIADYIISCDVKSIEEIAEEILLLKKIKELT